MRVSLWSRRILLPATLTTVALLLLLAAAGPAGACHPGRYLVESWVVSDGSGTAGAPATDGEVIAWADDRGGDLDVYARDAEGGEEWLADGGPGDQTDPAVCDGQVFWVDRGGAHPTVWTMDPDTETAVQVSAGAADQVSAGDGRVAWTDRSGADADIVAHDPASGETWTVCDAVGDQVAPAVAGELVAWQDHRDGEEPDIYARDGEDEAFAVTVAEGAQTDPAAYGALVLWADDRDGDTDIYGADVDELRWGEGEAGDDEGFDPLRCVTQPEFVVCDAAGDQTEPAVGGPMAYWTDLARCDGQGDVMGRDLTWGGVFAVAEGAGRQSAAATACDGELIMWNDGAGDVPVVVAGWLEYVEGDVGDDPGPVDKWTTDEVVTLFLAVLAKLGVFDEVRFAVDDGDFGEWQPLTGTTAVQLPPHDGAHVIHIQLADSSLPAGTPGSEDDPFTVDVTTTLDTRGPVTLAPWQVVVKKGAVATFRVKARDALSPSAVVTVQVKNRAGKVVKVVTLGKRTTGKLVGKRFTADLRRGRYTYRVLATDLAGNRQSRAGWNRLIVR